MYVSISKNLLSRYWLQHGLRTDSISRFIFRISCSFEAFPVSCLASHLYFPRYPEENSAWALLDCKEKFPGSDFLHLSDFKRPKLSAIDSDLLFVFVFVCLYSSYGFTSMDGGEPVWPRVSYQWDQIDTCGAKLFDPLVFETYNRIISSLIIRTKCYFLQSLPTSFVAGV